MLDEVFFSASQLLVIVMVVGLTEKVKDILVLENKKWYTLFALGFSVLFGFVSPESGDSLRQIAFSIVLYFSGAVVLYDNVVQYIEKKKQTLELEK